jgi:hypothetical protein
MNMVERIKEVCFGKPRIRNKDEIDQEMAYQHSVFRGFLYD